jgi:DNA invertase Pin-like site-specific DNA recombinase
MGIVQNVNRNNKEKLNIMRLFSKKLLILGCSTGKLKNMKILYTRVSSLEGQKTDRQRTNEKDYDLIIEDKCSGSIPFFERDGGKKILKLIDSIESLSVHQIDRLGRDLRDIMNTIHFFNERLISIHFIQQNLSTLDNDKKENPITKMIISVLGTIGEMERKLILERQREGIEIAKIKGVYKGRVKGSKENIEDFLSKEKNKKSLELLRKGYKGTEVSKIVGIHINTITKLKKYI